MSDPKMLAAELLVGGLWDGCFVTDRLAPELWAGLLIHGYPDGSTHTWDEFDGASDARRLDELALLLPGPLQLGTAGLISRVRERLCLPDATALYNTAMAALRMIAVAHGIDTNDEFNAWLLDFDAVGAGGLKSLVRASEHLAAGDALCAAGGLELGVGEIPRWSWTSMGCWELQTNAGMRVFAGDTIVGAANETVVLALRETGRDMRRSLLECESHARTA